MHFDLRDGTDKSLAIRSGDLDVAYVSKDAAEDLQRAGAAVIEGLKDSAWYFLSFNNRKPRKPFDDIRVRSSKSPILRKPRRFSKRPAAIPRSTRLNSSRGRCPTRRLPCR